MTFKIDDKMFFVNIFSRVVGIKMRFSAVFHFADPIASVSSGLEKEQDLFHTLRKQM